MKHVFNKLRHFLVPSHRNNYRAKALHIDTLLLLLAFATIVSFVTSIDSATRVLGFATDITIEKLFEETNTQRVNNGLPPLQYNNTLAHAAQNKASDMFTYDYWAHYRPGDGTSPWDFIKDAGYTYEYAGENLARDFAFSKDVVQGWMDSETHRANILRAEYDEVGFAVVNGSIHGRETTLVVQMFGKPAIAIEENLADASNEANSLELENTEPENTENDTSQTINNVEEENEENSEQKQDSGNLFVGAVQAQEPPSGSNGFITTEGLKFNTSFLLLGLLFFIILVDLAFAYRLKLIRITGKNLAHSIFLGSLIIALVIVKSGLIL